MPSCPFANRARRAPRTSRGRTSPSRSSAPPPRSSAPCKPVRRARIFHPRGDGFVAEVDVDRPLHRYDGIGLLSERHTYTGVARLSRAAGIPAPLPDVLGLAFRIDTGEGPQDLLLVSSGRAPGLRHLLLPTRGGFGSNTYSSILPYRIGDDLRLFGAEPVGPLEYELGIAPLNGPWEPFGRLRIRAALDPQTTEALRLNPWNTLPGIEPVGPLNGLRRSSYAGSQQGRSAARSEEVAQ
jgi:hypothetical protein